MPAGSEPRRRPAPVTPPELPATWRPLGPRVAGLVAAFALTAIVGLLWMSFTEEVQASVSDLQKGTVVFFGLIGFACLWAMGRSKVRATPDRLTVVNGFRRHEYHWAEVVAVRLDPGAPWVTLDLADGTSAAAMGIQSSDGDRARVAVRQLRVLADRLAGGSDPDGPHAPRH